MKCLIKCRRTGDLEGGVVAGEGEYSETRLGTREREIRNGSKERDMEEGRQG
jgi:hypothetical protein